MSEHVVSAAVWSILNQPSHRSRWEPWNRPGVSRRPVPRDDLNGAQICIAWVVEAYRYGESSIRTEWATPDSTPSSRSAVQRFFAQGARLTSTDPAAPVEKLTRSRVLGDIARAFEFNDSEVIEIRQALAAAGEPVRNRHMGQSFHTWEVARTDADLRGVIELSRATIGGRAGFKQSSNEPPSAADIAPLRRRLDGRADALELCIRQELDGDDEYLVGYLFVYPLTAEITGRILRGEVTGAEQFTETDVAATHAEESALYIAMVLGADLAARAAVMERCIQRVSKWSAVHPEGQVLAKRSTEDGQRWLENYGFVPITVTDAIWLRDSETPAYRRRKRRLVASVS